MKDLILWAIFLLLSAVILMWSGLEKEWRKEQARKRKLQLQREQIVGRKASFVEKYVANEKKLAAATKTNRNSYLALLAISIVGGLLFGKLVFMDTFISLGVAGACIILPHAYLVLKKDKDSRELAENLESAMRIITHEYIHTLDIQKAVENSVDVIDHDKPFRQFLVDCKMISSNIERNLRRLEAKENNEFFSRWIDQLILVQSDRNQLGNLMPILDNMNDAKTAQRRNDTQVAGAWRDYFTMLFIILLSPLMIRFVQYEWYTYLVTTPIGKFLIILLLGSLVWSTGRAMKINTPITG